MAFIKAWIKILRNEFFSKDTLAILGFAYILSPFFILAVFNHPSADDFSYANKSIHLGIWHAMVQNYTTWSGRYFSTALLSINPLVFKSFFFYKFIAVLLILALFHALYQLVHELTGQYFHKKESTIAALTLLILYMSGMPSVVGGFYWASGAITYQVANILTVYLCAVIVRQYRDRQIKSIISSMAVSFLLIFAIVGSNETSMELLFLLLLLMLSASFYIKRKIDWILMTFIVWTVTASYFVVSAPGNAVRLSYFPHHQNIFWACGQAFSYGLKSIWQWAAVLPMAGFTILFIPIAAQFAIKRIKGGNNLFINPLFALGGFFIFLVAGLFPAYWSMGDAPPPRTSNVIYLFFLLSWFFNVYVFVEHCVRKHKMIFEPLPRYVTVVIFIFISLSFIRKNNDSNLQIAYADLFGGKAWLYDKQLTQRYKMFTESKLDIIEVNRLNKTPKTLFFDDITDNAGDWTNMAYADYFHKKSIVIARSTKSKE